MSAYLTQGQEWHIEHGAQHAVIAQRGGALRTYTVGGNTVIADVADDELPTAFHGAVLAPWPNRITSGRWEWDGATQQVAITEPATDSALHGLLAWVPWQLRANDASSVTLFALVLPQPGYPFAVEVSVTWAVSAAGLRCELSAHNVGPAAAPFGVSTHPYFALSGCGVDDLTLTLPADEWLRTDVHLHPVQRETTAGTAMDFTAGASLRDIALDTAFTGLRRCSDGSSQVTLAADDQRLELWADASFGWWQVYTSDYFPPGSPHQRAAVALEAMTCGPDAFNTGEDLIVLEPDQRWAGAWGVQLTRSAG